MISESVPLERHQPDTCRRRVRPAVGADAHQFDHLIHLQWLLRNYYTIH